MRAANKGLAPYGGDENRIGARLNPPSLKKLPIGIKEEPTKETSAPTVTAPGPLRSALPHLKTLTLPELSEHLLTVANCEIPPLPAMDADVAQWQQLALNIIQTHQNALTVTRQTAKLYIDHSNYVMDTMKGLNGRLRQDNDCLQKQAKRVKRSSCDWENLDY